MQLLLGYFIITDIFFMDKQKVSKNDLRTRKSSTQQLPVTQNDFYSGQREFTLPNGDKYVGDYCAHRNGLLWREGQGTYYTQDGHTYEGVWRDDQLVDKSPVTISYPDGVKFHGTLSNNMYEQGEIILNHGFRVIATFQENQPDGTVYMIDSNGHLWKSYTSPANLATNKIYLRREQEFYNNIHPLRGIKKEKLQNIEPSWVSESKTSKSDVDETTSRSVNLTNKELEIFSKKPKVDTRMNWEDSPWYKEFVAYKHKRERVLFKLEKHEYLTHDELRWYSGYVKAQRLRRQQSKNDINEIVDTSLLDRFYSEAHRRSTRPYATYYPTYYWHTQKDQEEEEESMNEDVLMLANEEEQTESMEEEQYKQTVSTSSDEEKIYNTPNPSVACETKSLFDFVQAATGRQVVNPCQDITQSKSSLTD